VAIVGFSHQSVQRNVVSTMMRICVVFGFLIFLHITSENHVWLHPNMQYSRRVPKDMFIE
jgi:hypothetical protein